MCKKRKKKKKEKNPGKIQLARDPTASDDACPRPILGWPVYLPQPLAGARITEKRRRRPNHVTRFPLRALSLCLSVALSCIIYYSAAAATMYTSPSLRHVQVGSPPKFLPFNPPYTTLLLLLLCIRLHLLDMYKLAPLPNFSPSTPLILLCCCCYYVYVSIS